MAVTVRRCAGREVDVEGGGDARRESADGGREGDRLFYGAQAGHGRCLWGVMSYTSNVDDEQPFLVVEDSEVTGKLR